MEQSMDVDYRRAVEWLLERRKLPSDWNSRLRAISIRQKDLLTDLASASEPHIKAFQPGDLPGYLQAKEVVEKLEKTQEAAKGRSMLGNWQSTYLHNWTRLLQLYLKDNLHLADCGKHLLQLAQYDLSALKQQLNQCEKQLQDDEQRQITLGETADRMKKMFRDQCAKLGIDGVAPRTELKALTRKLPILYKEVHDLVLSPELAGIISQYREVSKSNHNTTVRLPAIEELISIGPLDISVPELQDRYAPLIPAGNEIEAEEVAIADEGKEWAIETVGSGIGISSQSLRDFPYSDRSLRNRVITDFEELEAFCDMRKVPNKCVRDVLERFKEAQPLLLMKEQPAVIEEMMGKLEELKRDRGAGQLAMMRKVAEETRATMRQTLSQIQSLKETCRRLISALQEGIPPLFPNVKIRIIGDIMRDLAHKD